MEASTEIPESAISLTDKAAEKIRELLGEDPYSAGQALRVAVRGGGCSGFTYKFGMADAVEADDHVSTTDGVDLVIDEMSLDLLRGSQVDFVESLGGTRFEVTNPNAASGCGCGSSFSI